MEPVKGRVVTALLDRPPVKATEARWPEDRVHVAAATLLILVVALAIGFLGDPRVASGSDVGGKLATVKVMAEGDTWSPDVGYWAEALDPDGRFHQLLKTAPTDAGWIQVTGLPLILPAVPLWDAGGASALLLLTVGSAPLAALAARRLARQLGADSGWGAFWLVGLGSPVLVYSADFWEHGPSVAAGLWAVTLAVGLPDERPGRGAFVKIVALGTVTALAVLLRLEVGLSLVGVGACLLAVRAERRRLLGAVGRFGLAGVIAAATYAGWSRLESDLLGSAIRSSRGGSQLGDVGSDLAQRGQDAMLTAVGVWASDSPVMLIVGAAMMAVLGVAIVKERDGEPLGVAMIVFAPLVLVLRALTGLGFVPGALPAAPGSAAALASRSKRERALAVGAVSAMVATWALQWKGGMLAQWGGRYLLVPAALLTVTGAVSMERIGWRRPAVMAIVASSVIVSGFGATWHVVRSNSVADAIAQVEAVPADVLIVATGVDSGRTSGAWYGDHRWLTATGDLDEIMEIASRAGIARVDVVYPEPLDGERPIGGAVEGDRRVIDVVAGTVFTVVSYAPTG